MWFVGALMGVCMSALLLRYYAERQTKWYVLSLVCFSWSLGFFHFLVLPFDIEHAFCRLCHAQASFAHADPAHCRCVPSASIELLPRLIPIAYGVTMLLGYLMNDLIREYINSGEFTARGKMRDALKEAAVFYVPAILIGIILLVYMVVHEGLSFEGVRGVGRGMVNAIGLFILIGFLGYGLVEVPRHLWNKGDSEGQMRYLQFKVALKSEV